MDIHIIILFRADEVDGVSGSVQDIIVNVNHIRSINVRRNVWRIIGTNEVSGVGLTMVSIKAAENVILFFINRVLQIDGAMDVQKSDEDVWEDITPASVNGIDATDTETRKGLEKNIFIDEGLRLRDNVIRMASAKGDESLRLMGRFHVGFGENIIQADFRCLDTSGIWGVDLAFRGYVSNGLRIQTVADKDVSIKGNLLMEASIFMARQKCLGE